MALLAPFLVHYSFNYIRCSTWKCKYISIMLFILGHEKDVEIKFWGGGTREAASLDVSNEILLVTFVRIILSEGIVHF